MGTPIAENPFLPPAESQRQPQQVQAMLEEGALLVDVREIGELAEIRIPEAENLPASDRAIAPSASRRRSSKCWLGASATRC